MAVQSNLYNISIWKCRDNDSYEWEWSGRQINQWGGLGAPNQRDSSETTIIDNQYLYLLGLWYYESPQLHRNMLHRRNKSGVRIDGKYRFPSVANEGLVIYKSHHLKYADLSTVSGSSPHGILALETPAVSDPVIIPYKVIIRRCHTGYGIVT